MLKCKKCGGQVNQHEHIDEMLKFEVNDDGTAKEMPFDREYTGRAIEMYGACEECGQIYEYDISQNKVLLDSPLDDYPGITEMW